MKKWKLKEKFNFAKEYINKKYTSIKRKIKNKTKILYLRAMQRNSIKIKKELELITKIANVSSDLLKITSLASILIIIISFVIYNYFHISILNEVPFYDYNTIFDFGIKNILAFIIAFILVYTPFSATLATLKTYKENKINIKNKILSFIVFFLTLPFMIAFITLMFTLLFYGLAIVYVFENIENNTQVIDGNKLVIPILVFFIICMTFIFTKIREFYFKIIWIITIIYFIYNLNFNFYSILGLGKYKADIIISQSDLSFSYILKKYKQTHENNVIPKCENQEQVCVLDDGRLSIGNVEILFDSGSVVHVENIYNPNKVLKIKSENIDIEKIDRQNNKSSETNNESKKQNGQDLEKSKESKKEENTTKNN